MLKPRLLLIAVLLMSSGCATTGSSNLPTQPETKPLSVEPEVIVVPKVVDNYCVLVKPIYLNPADVLVDNSFNQIKEHNQQWLKKCGKK